MMGSLSQFYFVLKVLFFTNELKLPIVKLLRQHLWGERKGKFEFSGRFYVLEACPLFD